MTAGLRFRPAAANALVGTRPGKKKKPPKWVAVGKGKTSIPGGEARKVALRLNKTGVALLRQRSKATIKVTVKIRSDGVAGVVTDSHTIHVVLKKKKPKR